MKISELLKESEHNFDSKNITNKGTGKVSNEILEQIEAGGITSELLESFPFPIFKYRTQITLHGIFETEQNYFRSGGYKNLIVNKNRSLGVRYSGIDIEKKRFIQHVLNLEKSRFTLHLDSTGCEILSFLILSETNLETMKKVFTMLPKNYIGFSQLYISHSMIGSFVVIRITLNAIYEKEIFPFLAGLLGKEYNKDIYEASELAEKERSEREYNELVQQNEKERIERKKIFEQAKTEFLVSHQIRYLHTFACGRYLYFGTDFNDNFCIKIFHLFQSKNKKYMFYTESVNDLNNIPKTNALDCMRKQLHGYKLQKFQEKLNTDFYFKLV